MYNVKNVSKDVRKFLDRNTGKEILVKPNESVYCKNPPRESSVWEISEGELKTKITKLKEDK